MKEKEVNKEDISLKDRKLGRALRRLEREERKRERERILSKKILEAWRMRDTIIADQRMYVTELPDCKSGTSFAGQIYLPIGALLECWMNCSEFRLPDGRYIIRFASGLSDFTEGEAISMNTGKISRFSSSAMSAHSRSSLINSSLPYRKKARGYIDSGVEPFKPEEW